MARFEIELPSELHPDSKQLILNFAAAMGEKMLKSQIKRGMDLNWQSPEWEAECQAQLQHHVDKGDPLDVGIYSAFCHYHGWETCEEPAADLVSVNKRVDFCLILSKNLINIANLAVEKQTKFQLAEYYIRKFLIDMSKAHLMFNAQDVYSEHDGMAQVHLSVAIARLKDILQDTQDWVDNDVVVRLMNFQHYLKNYQVLSLSAYNLEYDVSELDNPPHPDMNVTQTRDLNATLNRLAEAADSHNYIGKKVLNTYEALVIYSATIHNAQGKIDSYIAILLKNALQLAIKSFEEGDNSLGGLLTKHEQNMLDMIKEYSVQLEDNKVPGVMQVITQTYAPDMSKLLKAKVATNKPTQKTPDQILKHFGDGTATLDQIANAYSNEPLNIVKGELQELLYVLDTLGEENTVLLTAKSGLICAQIYQQLNKRNGSANLVDIISRNRQLYYLPYETVDNHLIGWCYSLSELSDNLYGADLSEYLSDLTEFIRKNELEEIQDEDGRFVFLLTKQVEIQKRLQQAKDSK